jgi:predicted RND superfamily exporter protein
MTIEPIGLLTGPLKRPWLALVIALLLSAASLWIASRSRASGSIQDLLGTRDPAARALARVLEDFPSADELLLLVSDEAQDRSEEDRVAGLRSCASTLSATLTTDPSTASLCRSVSWAASPELLEFIKNEAVPAGLLYLTDEEFASLLGRLSPDAMREQLHQDEAMVAAPGPAADALARTLIKDPLRLREFLGSRLEDQRAGFRTWQGGPEFISEDGRHLLVRVAGVRPPSDLAFCKELTAKVTAVAQRVGRGLSVRASGAYAIAAASEQAIRHDLTGSIVWSLVIMQAVFLLGYRNLLAFIAAFAPVALGLCVAFGVHALITPALTPLTAVIGASLVGCGIDYSIYLLSYYETARIADRGLGPAASKPGAPASANGFQSPIPNPQSTMAAALRSLAMPLIAGCATSIVGFAAVAFSRVHALRDFAVLGALGLAFALAAAMA